MNRLRGVGMKRLALVPVLLLLAGCGELHIPAAAPSVAPEPSPTASQTPWRYTPPPRTSFTPAEQALLDAMGMKAGASGVEDYLESARDLCRTFNGLTDDDVLGGLLESSKEERINAGKVLLLLCDNPTRYAPLVVAAETGMPSGTYYVGDGPDQIKPGTYRTVGAAKNCYWERKAKGGDIIDNDIVTNAPGGVRLTVKASDYEVTMRRCGVWVPHQG